MINLWRLQRRVARWGRSTFGEGDFLLPGAAQERALRHAEEATELAQSMGVTADQLHCLVDYVYARPVGLPERELGQCLVTLLATAECLGVVLYGAVLDELDRIEQPEVVERCRARQAEKRAALVTDQANRGVAPKE